MNEYSRLKDYLKGMNGSQIAVYQGIVKKVDGVLCEVQVGNITVPDVRLRASELEDDGHMLIVPKTGTAVIIGSLSGDLSQLAVLQVDHVESIVVNGGKLGGLVNIETLTAKINSLVDTFNNHMHVGAHGTTSAPTAKAARFSRSDYEDSTIKH